MRNCQKHPFLNENTVSKSILLLICTADTYLFFLRVLKGHETHLLTFLTDAYRLHINEINNITHYVYYSEKSGVFLTFSLHYSWEWALLTQWLRCVTHAITFQRRIQISGKTISACFKSLSTYFTNSPAPNRNQHCILHHACLLMKYICAIKNNNWADHEYMTHRINDVDRTQKNGQK